MTKTKIDALLVLNAEISVAAVSRLLESKGIGSAAFVSTHAFYPDEKERLASAVKGRVDFFSFADFLSREELDAIDEQARLELDAAATLPKRYVTSYENRITLLKNELVQEKVEQAYDFGALFCAGGLGVEKATWAGPRTEAILMARGSGSDHLFRRVLNKLAKFRRYSLYRDSHYAYVVMGAVSRIGLTQPARFSMSLPVILDWLVAPILKGLRSLPSVRICCSIHDRHPLARFVFVDGYHPSNYPYSYLGSYLKDAVFLVSSELNGRWFQRHGFKTEVAHELLRAPLFREVEIEEATQNRVLLLLNHAGDWGAIINRSDTEKLVMALCNVAQRLPNIEFVIRPHPTSIHPKHEGQSAIARLRGFVEWLSCSNISVSRSTLGEDISAADLCISEYSLTLVNCYEQGIPGLIANFTGRHSLMEDYQSFGFAYVDDEDAMFDAISEFATRPGRFSDNQNRACRIYNAELREAANTCSSREPMVPSQETVSL